MAKILTKDKLAAYFKQTHSYQNYSPEVKDISGLHGMEAIELQTKYNPYAWRYAWTG